MDQGGPAWARVVYRTSMDTSTKKWIETMVDVRNMPANKVRRAITPCSLLTTLWYAEKEEEPKVAAVRRCPEEDPTVDGCTGSVTLTKGDVCEVVLWFDDQRIRVLFDTGSARDLIDKAFAAAVRRSPNMKGCCVVRQLVTNPLHCIGVTNGSVTPKIEKN